MKNIVNEAFVVIPLILTVLGCASVEKQETIISPQERKAENVVNLTPENNVTSKTTLIFDVSSCSWSYTDENGILEAVSIMDGKPQYVRSGSVHYIDLDKSKIVFK